MCSICGFCNACVHLALKGSVDWRGIVRGDVRRGPQTAEIHFLPSKIVVLYFLRFNPAINNANARILQRVGTLIFVTHTRALTLFPLYRRNICFVAAVVTGCCHVARK